VLQSTGDGAQHGCGVMGIGTAWLRRGLLVLFVIGLAACASIPKGQYGVDSIEWRGTKQMSADALASCLVTREREAVRVRLGISSPSCGSPPFDSSAPSFDLWTLPWEEWPVYDPAIFDVEKERIERWYRARGYYNAHVVSVKTYADGKQVDADECQGSGSDCELKIVVEITEGEPTLVSAVTVATKTALPAKLMASLRGKVSLRSGERFDEAGYEADKQGLQTRLRAASYARAQVHGKVIIDRETRKARVEYQLEPGPACVFGALHVEGADDVPIPLIVDAAAIPIGKPYDPEALDDAQRAIFALGVFSSVKLELVGEGSTVDVQAKLQRGRIVRWSAGLGMMSGTLKRPTSEETNSVPQWDFHLKGSYLNKNFLGGLRKLSIEERPRLIMLAEFPRFVGDDRKVNYQLKPGYGPQLGNMVSLRFEQPAAFEARTKFVGTAGWDLGPDPFLGFFRHDIAVKVGFERPFWKQRLLGRVAVEHDIYDVTEPVDQRPEGVSDYKLPFLEQQIILDVRDNALRPRLGAYVSVITQEAASLGSYGAWDYFRVLPEVRGYVPLMWDVVLAARFAMGALFILDSARDLDPISAQLGPTAYRLRGGGANSNRGFAAGRLGDSSDGGSRRWEGSLELRVPLGGDVGVTLFGDVGDVYGGVQMLMPGEKYKPRATPFRFKHVNTALGFGLRYHSILGALRLDLAWRVPGWQIIGSSEKEEPVKSGALPSAVHLTIGEAF
jgi:translocation and assembly module TamA